MILMKSLLKRANMLLAWVIIAATRRLIFPLLKMYIVNGITGQFEYNRLIKFSIELKMYRAFRNKWQQMLEKMIVVINNCEFVGTHLPW